LYGFGDFRYIHAFKDNSHTTIATKTKYRKFVNSSLLGGNYISHHKQEKENAYVDYKIKKLILNPYFSPLMASDEELSRLPNTYITVSEYTVVRDEGMILAERLMKLNHTVKYSYLEGMSDGIFRYVEFKRFNEEYKRLAVYINATFERSRSYS
jgi:acetyl esterase/lipase